MGHILSKYQEFDDPFAHCNEQELSECATHFLEENGASFIQDLEGKGLLAEDVPVKGIRPNDESKFLESEWWTMLQKEEVMDVTSTLGKRFRRRFRIPAVLLRDVLVPLCIEREVFGTNKRKHRIPVELKCMIALRRLGRGECFDTVSELSRVPIETCRIIFIQFVHNMYVKLKDDFIKFPEIGSPHMQKQLSIYAQLGLPGAIGSMDCTHVKWNKCPFNKQTLCRGAKGYPTIAFEAVCDHFGKILHISQGFYGSNNDKIIEKFCLQ